MSDELDRWLERQGLGKFARLFAENEITFSALPHLTEEDLKELGLPLGPRRIAMAAIADLVKSAGASAPERAASTSLGDAERRHLTILFCDLVGSTALSTRLDPEDMRELLRAYQEACARVVASYDGYVAKYIGDGVLAYFGYPRAHEDDAERAINTGLDIVAAVRQVRIGEIELAVRIGIATGPVVVGDLIGEGAAQEAAVTGETPNLAARLQAEAQPNGVVIAEATHRLAGGLFECTDLGHQLLKGFAVPVHLWSVLRPRHIESRFEATRALSLTRLIGRDEELELLSRRWRRAKEGHGQVVLITGEPGIGKSRLVRELQERVTGEPHIRLRYQCSPYHLNSALFPVVDQLARAAHFAHADSAVARLDKLETLLTVSGREDAQTRALFAQLLSVPAGDRYLATEMSPAQRKERTLGALIGQLEGLAEQKPVLFIFEDLHWVDPTTLELLERTVSRIRDMRVLALITYRPEFVAPWTGSDQVTLLMLNRLSRDDRVVMAENIAGSIRLPEQLLREISSRTDGVPLFVEELTKSTLESGQLSGRDDQHEFSGVAPQVAVPETLQDALMARLDRLSSIKDIVQAGACIGREFSYELLAQVTRATADTLRSALEQLASADLISCRGTPPAMICAFKHALVQDAAYASLLRNQRSAIHARIVEVLENSYRDVVQAQPELVAHHLIQAGAIERAIPYLEQAGRNAAQKFANTEALRHFHLGVELLNSLPDSEVRRRQELSLQLNLPPISMVTKGFGSPEVEAGYSRARELAEELGDQESLFTAIWGLWIASMVRPKKGAARRYSEKLLTLSTRSGDSTQVLQAHHASWTTNFSLGAFAYCLEQAAIGSTMYDPIEHRAHKFLYGGHDPGVCGHNFSCLSRLFLGFPDEARANGYKALELGEEINHPLSLLTAKLWLTRTLLVRGDEADVLEAEGHLDRAIQLAADTGISQARWANFLAGWILSARGNPEEGRKRILQDFESLAGAGQDVFRAFDTGVLADVCRVAGRRGRTLDRRRVEFSGFLHDGGLAAPP
jgi:class 3 adenylate cyclase/tetratricopeptide (TPR) repeat protein